MRNIYEPRLVRVIKKTKENFETSTLELQLKNKKDQVFFAFLAGQFIQVGIPGFGEAPFTFSSNSRHANKGFSITVRDVGTLSHKINQLKIGDEIFIRGPLGNGFPEIKKNTVLIGGGCGFIPLKGLIDEYAEQKEKKQQLKVFLGCRNYESILFKKSFPKWQKHLNLHVVAEQCEEKKPAIQCEIGMVTDAINKYDLYEDADFFMCGPPIMYKFVVQALQKKKVPLTSIYASLERKMYCGNGLCQHCAIGPYYVCKDGPVFNWADVVKYDAVM